MNNHEKEGFAVKVDKEKLLVKLSKQFYEKHAVFSAAYKFTNKCFILIEPLEDNYVGVFFQPKQGESPEMLSLLLHEYCNEVLDQQLRLDLEKRYGNLRDTLVKHAFLPFEGSSENNK
jgi:His-Xaa-Ser system protein HxsD